MPERIEAEDEFSDLEQLYNEVSRMNQVMKLIHVRLFVSGRTIAEVENNAKEIMMFRTAAWITLIILAAVGILCLIYPETRTELFRILAEII